MKTLTPVLAATILAGAAAPMLAQESGVTVRSVRVLATDPEAVATFYEKAFGMAETRRPVNTANFKEIIINSGSTPELARKATSTPIVIATRPNNAPVSAMPSLILNVPDLDQAVERVQAAGGTLARPVSKAAGVSYAFVKDPDGNQIELVLSE